MVVLGSPPDNGIFARGISVPKGSLDVWRAARDDAANNRYETVWFGDSTLYGNSDTSSNNSWLSAVRTALRADGITDGGVGYFNTFQAKSNPSGAANGSITWLPESVAHWTATGWSVTDPYTYSFPGIIASTTEGDVLTVTVPATHRAGATMRIWWFRYIGTGTSAGAQFKYKVNGGAETIVDTNPGVNAAQPIVSGGLWSPDFIYLTGLNPGDVVTITALGGIYERTPVFNASALFDNGAGALGAGTYWYVLTKTAAGGETLPCAAQSVTIPASHQVGVRINNGSTPGVSAVPGGTWNIYRGTSSGGPFLLVGSVTDSGGGSNPIIYNDNNASPGTQQPPAVNTAGLNKIYYTRTRLGVDLMNNTGIVFHNHGLPSSQLGAYFSVADTATNNIAAAHLLGLTNYTVSGNAGPDKVRKQTTGNGRKVALAALIFGANDVGFGVQSDAGSADRLASVDLFIRMARNAGADPLIIIPWTWGVTGELANAGRHRRELTSIARAANVACVDFQEALGPVAEMAPSGYATATVHLPPAGYTQIGNWLWQKVLSRSALPPLA